MEATQPGHDKNLVRESRGSRQAIGASRIELYLGACGQLRLTLRASFPRLAGRSLVRVKMLVAE
jgi:hypothetical protein